MSHRVDKIRPLNARILVRPAPMATHVGLIEIPETAREKHAAKYVIKFGTVVHVGPGMLMKNGERWPIDVKPGDRILYRDDGAYKTKFDVVDGAGEVIEQNVLHHWIRDGHVEGVVEG